MMYPGARSSLFVANDAGPPTKVLVVRSCGLDGNEVDGFLAGSMLIEGHEVSADSMKPYADGTDREFIFVLADGTENRFRAKVSGKIDNNDVVHAKLNFTSGLL